MNTKVASATVNSATINISFELVFFSSLDKYPEVVLLGRMAILFLIF